LKAVSSSPSSTRCPRSADAEFAWNTGWNRVQGWIDDVELIIRYRPSDGNAEAVISIGFYLVT
jgi:hypothetical protein